MKVVGVSDKYDLVAEAERVIQAEFEHGIHARCTTASRDCEPSVSATRSQPYYLDVTHPKANKGAVVEWLSEYLKISSAEIVTIGDISNDVLMFQKSRYSIAMGQASDEVKKSATYVTGVVLTVNAWVNVGESSLSILRRNRRSSNPAALR